MNNITLYLDGYERAQLEHNGKELYILNTVYGKDDEDLRALFADPENVELMQDILSDEGNWNINSYNDGRADYDTLECEYEDDNGNEWLLCAERFTA